MKRKFYFIIWSNGSISYIYIYIYIRIFSYYILQFFIQKSIYRLYLVPKYIKTRLKREHFSTIFHVISIIVTLSQHFYYKRKNMSTLNRRNSFVKHAIWWSSHLLKKTFILQEEFSPLSKGFQVLRMPLS